MTTVRPSGETAACDSSNAPVVKVSRTLVAILGVIFASPLKAHRIASTTSVGVDVFTK